jgi:hypothetical protein
VSALAPDRSADAEHLRRVVDPPPKLAAVPASLSAARDGSMIDVAIVGAQKCGTTTLAAVLATHPGLCLAEGKEAHLFDDQGVQREGLPPDWVDHHFGHRTRGQLLLDATPSYLYLPGCIEALVRHNPAVRVIVLLRPPAERARSHHGHERRRGAERLPFALGLLLERRRLRRDRAPLADGSAHRVWSYRDRGRYAGQLRRVAALVPNLHVTTLADLGADPIGEVTAIHRFLGLEEVPPGPLPRLNAAPPAADRRGWPMRAPIDRLLEWSLRSEADAAADLLGWPRDRLRSGWRGASEPGATAVTGALR